MCKKEIKNNHYESKENNHKHKRRFIHHMWWLKVKLLSLKRSKVIVYHFQQTIGLRTLILSSKWWIESRLLLKIFAFISLESPSSNQRSHQNKNVILSPTSHTKLSYIHFFHTRSNTIANID